MEITADFELVDSLQLKNADDFALLIHSDAKMLKTGTDDLLKKGIQLNSDSTLLKAGTADITNASG